MNGRGPSIDPGARLETISSPSALSVTAGPPVRMMAPLATRLRASVTPGSAAIVPIEQDTHSHDDRDLRIP